MKVQVTPMSQLNSSTRSLCPVSTTEGPTARMWKSAARAAAARRFACIGESIIGTGSWQLVLVACSSR